jgi:hypothetical protein
VSELRCIVPASAALAEVLPRVVPRSMGEPKGEVSAEDLGRAWPSPDQRRSRPALPERPEMTPRLNIRRISTFAIIPERKEDPTIGKSVEELYQLYQQGRLGFWTIPETFVWKSMNERCQKPNHPIFKYYGGRGITVCNEWQNDFWKWFRHVGRRPVNLTLDRIDNFRGYEPGNVRWATYKEQGQNKRHVILLRRLHEEEQSERKQRTRSLTKSEKLEFLRDEGRAA